MGARGADGLEWHALPFDRREAAAPSRSDRSVDHTTRSGPVPVAPRRAGTGDPRRSRADERGPWRHPGERRRPRAPGRPGGASRQRRGDREHPCDERTSEARDRRRRSSLVQRSFLESVADPGEPRILAGDLNMLNPSLPGFRERRAGRRSRTRRGAAGVAVDRLASGATHAEWRRALGSRTGRASRRVTFEEARAQFPVLEKIAYLNAGTFGPLARPTYEALTRRARRATTATAAAAGRTSSG